MLGAQFLVGTWTAGGALNFRQGVGNITWSNLQAVGPSSEQLSLWVQVPAAGAANAIVHLQWSTSGQATDVSDEIIEAPGALAGGEQRYTCNIKAWGPLSPGASIMIERPVAAAFFRVGVYSDNVPAGPDSVVVKCVPSRGAVLQASGS